MEPFELDPMALIEAQQNRINALTTETVQLTAAVAMLRQQVATQTDVINNDLLSAVEDVTDVVVRAEITA